MELKIYMRYTQFKAAVPIQNLGITSGSNIVYAGNNPSVLLPALGTVAHPDYVDFSDSVSNLDEIAITFTTNRDTNGEVTQGIVNTKKTASNQIVLEGAAYQFVKGWLIDNVSAYLNSIDVKIVDVGCGAYDDFVITPSMVTWSEDQICQFSVTLQQKAPFLQCIQQTVISDNWQGWFQETPANGKKYPRFLYCNEARPNALIILIWWLLSYATLILLILSPVIISILLVIDFISWLINVIRWIIGQQSFTTPNISNIQNLIDMPKVWYLSATGCSRFHPAPFIRDYIDNVCMKCGIKVDGTTDPLFHNEYLNINASSGKKVNEKNHYYNATYLFAPYSKGRHLFKGVFGQDANTSVYYLVGNRPLEALDQFLDKIKPIFNADWSIRNINGQPYLYFMRKDLYIEDTFLYDFSLSSPDRAKILSGITYTWNEKVSPTFMNGLYTPDASDTSGNEALRYMNDDVLLGDSTDNPKFSGTIDRAQPFGATRFRLDGADSDYIMDAVNVSLNMPSFNYLFLPLFLFDALKKYCDYALLIQNDTIELPKILIWDESSGFEFSKVIKNKNTYIANGQGAEPEINNRYNKNNTVWDVANHPIVSILSAFPALIIDDGVYKSNSPNYRVPAMLCNYPMFFASGYKDNLFDYFHWIDDGKYNPVLNLEWDVKIKLCCEDLNKLKVFNDSNDIKLLNKVKIPIPFYEDGIISEITVSYSSGENDGIGKYIELKGKN